MSSTNHRNVAANQSLYDFYEALVLLRSLGSWVQTSTEDAQNMNVQSSSSQLQHFLDQVSFVCDYTPGGTSVTAIALQQSSEGIIAVVATCLESKEYIEHRLNSVLQTLKIVHESSVAEIDRLQIQFCKDCLEFSVDRVFKYTNDFIYNLHSCRQRYLESDRLLEKDLSNLASLAANHQHLCDAAYCLRPRESMKQLSIKAQANGRSSNWSRLRHYIGRLGSWHHASRIIFEYARTNPEIFQNITVKAVPTPLSRLPPRADEQTRLTKVLCRMYSAEQMLEIKQAIDVLQKEQYNRERRFKLDKTFIKSYTDPDFILHVHAEAWLLEYFYVEELDFFQDYKYIGCSKPSCYCCDLYIKNHPGGFVQRATHGNVWPKWQAPLYQSPNELDRDVSIRKAMILKMKEDIRRQIGTPTARQVRMLDSTTGMTK